MVTKKAQREILKDIRQQVRVLEQAIKEGDQDFIEQLAFQLSATALNFESEYQ